MRCHTPNVADKAAVVHVPARAADADNVRARCDVTAGAFSQRHIFAAGGVGTERTNTDSRVVACSGKKKRATTYRGVAPPVAL